MVALGKNCVCLNVFNELVSVLPNILYFSNLPPNIKSKDLHKIFYYKFYSPEECERHESHATIVDYETENVVILEHIHHGEEITPVVRFLAHATDERKRPSARI